MQTSNIGFIGAGNMASALIGGLIADSATPANIRASDPDPGRRQQLEQQLGIQTTADNLSAVSGAQLLVLAVKPQQLRQVAEQIASAVAQHDPLVITIAAGVCLTDLNRWLGGKARLVRVMPNTPALLQAGAAGMFAGPGVDDEARNQAERLLRAVGAVVWVDDESQMDAVTAVSGSGPAYCFLVMEAMQNAAEALGLSPDTARLLTLQTSLGAARMALESEDSPATLRHKVTSPGGTTERAIEVFTQGGLSDLFAEAMQAARARSEELSRQLGSD